MVVIKTPEEEREVEIAGKKLGGLFDYIRPFVKPGVSTLELDKLSEDYIKSTGGKPSFNTVDNYPNTICSSVNDGIIHQIPSRDVSLKEGDLLKIDVGNIDGSGYQGDAARPFPVGKVTPKVQELMDATEEAFWEALKTVRPGSHVSDIGCAIQRVAQAHGFYALEEYGGHGIGTSMHEDPFIPNCGTIPHRGPVIRAGMCICIEPMLIMGTKHIKLQDDGWGVVSQDGSYGCHYENTICVYSDHNVIASVDESVRKHLAKEVL